MNDAQARALAEREERSDQYAQIMASDITDVVALTSALAAMDLALRMLGPTHLPEMGVFNPQYALVTRTRARIEEMLADEKRKVELSQSEVTS